MAFNGSGTFNRLYNWITDRDNNIKILAAKMDQEMDGFATGLSTCIARNGESTIISNLSLNNYKLTGLANGSSRTDSINIGQVQDGTYTYLGLTTGSADAYTLAPSAPVISYISSQRFIVKIHATNATTTPYLQISAIVNPATTAVIKKLSATKTEIAVEASDLLANGIYEFQRNSANDAWIVLNPEKTFYNLTNGTKATSTAQGINYLSTPTNRITAGNNSSTPNTDIDFFVGTMTFSDGSGQALSTAMTKRLQATGSWSAGNNGNMLLSGARANSSTYHLFAMYKTDGTVDYGALLGVAATDPNPTSVLPSGYTKYQYIMSLITDGTGNIRKGNYCFKTNSYVFRYHTFGLDRNWSSISATPTLLILSSIPLGIKVDANLLIDTSHSTGAGTSPCYILIGDPATNTTVSSSHHNAFLYHDNNVTGGQSTKVNTLTDKNARVSIAATTSGPESAIVTLGWEFNSNIS